MGKVIIYGLSGLVTLGLLLGLGITVKLIVRLFIGKREKRLEDKKGKDRYCHCGSPGTCPDYGPYRLHQHD